MPTFIKFPFEGYETDETHKGWVRAESFADAIDHSAQDQQNENAGEVTVGEISVTLATDATAGMLKRYALVHTRMPEVTIEVCGSDEGRTVQERHALRNACIRRIGASVSGNGQRTTTLAIGFDAILSEYRKPDQSYVTTGWSNTQRKLIAALPQP